MAITKQSQAGDTPPKAPDLSGLTEGRMVHYVWNKEVNNGEHRPAVVVKVWNKEEGYINLQVFTDGYNDGHEGGAGTAWRTNVTYSDGGEPGTWHWIEKA